MPFLSPIELYHLENKEHPSAVKNFLGMLIKCQGYQLRTDIQGWKSFMAVKNPGLVMCADTQQKPF